jgi:hypothetical protein
MKILNLDTLSTNIPVITNEGAGFYKENCMICLDNQGHISGVGLSVDYRGNNDRFDIVWTGHVTDPLKNAYRDLIRATDYGACAIALLLLRELTDYKAIEQAVIGTTVDYFLISDYGDDTLIFNHSARLEVSGILKESPMNTVRARISAKQRRLKPSTTLPALIIIVEFSNPKSAVVEP